MFVVVHSGARDNYQVALSLYSSRRLLCLVTDYYYLSSDVPHCFHRFLAWMYCDFAKRSHSDLPGSYVVTSKRALLFFILAKALSRWRTVSSRLLEVHDFCLASKARHLSVSKNAAILAYSTYASVAFSRNCNLKVLFLMHPYCKWVKDRLTLASQLTPRYHSLLSEYEFAISKSSFERLSQEPYLADAVICASTCSLKSIPSSAIAHKPHLVAPYGSRFNLQDHSFNVKHNWHRPIQIVSWGGLSERKRFSCFLHLSEVLEATKFTFHIAYRTVYDTHLLQDLASSPDIKLYSNLDIARLSCLLSDSDVLLFPSWVEGFGHVILEAMSFGIIPIVSKTTCGPDIIEHGKDGFILDDSTIDEIVSYLSRLEKDRDLLCRMQGNAYRKSLTFSELSFRAKVLDFLLSISE